MRWPTGREIAGATLLVAIAIAWIAAIFPGILPTEIEVCHQKEAQPADDDCAALHIVFVPLWYFAVFAERYADAIIAVGTLAIALFTLALWRSTNRLWEASKSTLTQNEQHLRTLERAYIFTGPDETLFVSPSSVESKITVTNYGNSLGIVKEVFAEFIEAVPTDEEPSYAGTPFITDLVVMPRQNNVLVGNKVTTTKTEFPLFMAGYVRYIDIMREEHISRFCARLEDDVIKPVGPPRWNEWD